MSKGFWKDYFSFSKKERIGVTILCFIIIVFVILPYFFSQNFKKPVVDQQLRSQLAALQNVSTKDTEGNNKNSRTDTTIKDTKSKLYLFYFDPNSLDENGLKKLGISDKTIHTIINYRNKGGYFKQPEDIRKIYGLKKEEADALIPYIKIKSKNRSENETPKTVAENIPSNQETKDIKKININTATAEDFRALPGISDVVGNRIVKFRNAIHGFKSVEDIKRTYGLPDSIYNHILPYLTISDSSIQKN